ncbi:RagB/SusD family nutrient uptake outer membrane protein [Mariniflexile sp. AS56]|uniref:RagB/SusD family nutrient uptake outer membrane protein n=1 Tax=Mariniflexile sp. AS56 TaxID=3063957 RepID=UPI0026EDA2DF|nr:RagB/SusD family nutrient uptake outer membrane protein [Mariniflexile sp. AS56]MDO7172507.1 RagB/SusD family nutrient uptake outer membrane protein [Mariniflexile sp. AS56]
MKKYRILCLIVMSVIGISCSDEFTVIVPTNDLTEGEVFNDVLRVRTFLNPAYSGVSSTPWFSLEYYTNNAVNVTGAESAAVSGATAEASPVSGQWSSAMNQIFKINEYFKSGFDIKYDTFSEEYSNALMRRLRGEAFGLRAYYKWLLLKNFAGPSATNGEMLGFPIVDEFITQEEVNNVPRSSYLECYKNIQKDLDSSYKYIDVLRYSGSGDIDGVRETSRISREVILSLKARMAVFAASPAYAQISWQEAAETAYEAIIEIDGGVLSDLQAFGNFNNTENRDHLWRRSYSSSGSLEQEYYPPSMFGRGTSNPSQNLVDAFPDSNGYPINHPSSIYNGINPYQNRDNRFERFIFHNGLNDFRNSYIEVFPGGQDANGALRKRATRTGYYMKKYLSDQVNLDTDQTSDGRSDYKVYAVFTRAGLYLDFAEAAIEAYGVNGKSGTMMFSAKDAITKVRTRPGTGFSNDVYIDEADDYLNSFRDLVHNERRLEFAFEGEYFYDVRRWKLSKGDLSTPVMGISVNKLADNTYTYESKEVEARNFTDRMYYNPIPRNEVLTSKALVQNAGWE